MEINSDSSAVEEVLASDVAETAVPAEPVAPPKATRKAPKKRGPYKKRTSKPAAKKPVEPTPVPLTVEEGKELLKEAKDDFIVAVAEPVMNVLGRYSQMVRDGVSGAVGGFLGTKKRDD